MLDQKQLKQYLIAIGILIVILAGIWVRYTGNNLKHRNEASNVGEVNENGAGAWEIVAGAALPDIVAFNFDKQGVRGVAVSSEGFLLVSTDDGINWNKAGRAPVEEGEIIGGVTVLDNGQIAVGTGVDESKYTAIYLYDGKGWQRSAGDYGGIGGASTRSNIFVGGNGLVCRWQNSQWQIQRLPACGLVMLYAVTQQENKLYAVGDYGMTFSSEDYGATWHCNSISQEENNPPLYAVACSGDSVLAGGAKGNLWRLVGDQWKKIRDDNIESNMFFTSIYLNNSNSLFAAGGNESGTNPFILHSQDNGHSWVKEQIPNIKGRILSITSSKEHLLAASMDGRLLMRKRVY